MGSWWKKPCLPSYLHSRHRPKSLIDIEGTTLISHVVRQLYRRLERGCLDSAILLMM